MGRGLTTVLAFTTVAMVAQAFAGEPPADELAALLARPVYDPQARVFGASKRFELAAQAPASLTVLTAGDIRAHGWRTLADILGAVRGLDLRNDHTYTYVGVRGLSRPGDFSSRLLVTIDGMRVNDNIFDQAVAGREFPLDVNLIDRVEVIPGPGSSLYGSNAVLAVVNIATKSGAAMRGAQGALQFGSAGERLLRASLGGEVGPAQWLIAALAERRRGHDYYFPEFDDGAPGAGVARGLDGERSDKLYARVRGADWSLTALLSSRRKDTPTAAYDTVFGAAPHRDRDRFALLDAQWQLQAQSDRSASLRLVAGFYRYDGVFPYASLFRERNQGRWVNAEGRWERSVGAHRWIVGLELQHNPLQHLFIASDDSPEAPENDLRRSTSRAGIYLSDRWRLSDALALDLGVRADRHANGRRSTTPRAALLWDPSPQLTLKLLGGKAFREPNFYEANVDDNVFKRNPGLSSETLYAREAVAEWRPLPGLRWLASAYRNRIDGLVEQIQDPADGMLSFANTGGARMQGMETELDWTRASGWRLRTSWSRQRARSATGLALSNAPRSLLKLQADAALTGSGWRLAVDLRRKGSRLSLGGTELPPYTLLGLALRNEAPGRAWSLAFGVDNLTGRRYQDPGGSEHRQDSLPGRPRAAWLRLDHGF